MLLEGAEELLNASVLPGRMRSGPLMPNAERSQGEAKKLRREEGLVVGSNGLGTTKLLHGVEDGSEDLYRCLGPQAP